MHLRAITLSGFKTFARRTEIRFEGGMVAIVGPNGSGKSNIVDAFKWVLGETQARDLRGRTMEEVIYAGGERSPRASQAEVALVLDNRDGRLPVDYEEVELKRRVERGGSSDYFLNGSRVRRRDLLHLLASTGLTTDSYSIVNQGDIEAIVTASPEQRRQLLEEAAQVRGVKQQRSEAAAKLADLAQNLLRLEDVRQELRPRLEGLGEQAEAAREAAAAQSRLEVLRGSIVWEEWREARDAHRRSSTQRQSLERRLEEAREQAAEAEAAFQAGRAAMETAQDRRLARQRVLGTLRLEHSTAEHALAMAAEKLANLGLAAQALGVELQELEGRARTAGALRSQLSKEHTAAEAALAKVPADPPPVVMARGDARAAAQKAEEARREAIQAASALASIRTRRQFLEETVARLEAQVLPAERDLPVAERLARETAEGAARAASAAAEIVRLRAELEGLEALWPAPGPGQHRVGDVLRPEPGYEAALSAVLGHLVDAWVAPDEPAAARALEDAGSQLTVVVRGPAPAALPGSLAEHVAARPGFEWLSSRLLGGVRVGNPDPPTVSLEGVFRDGLVYRAGPDRRVSLAARRRALVERIAGVEGLAAEAAGRAGEARTADAHEAGVRAAAAARGRLEEALAQLAAARAAEEVAATSLPALDTAAEAAARAAEALQRTIAEEERAQAGREAERRRLALERERWSERVGDLTRQLDSVAADLAAMEAARAARGARLAEAEAGQAGASHRAGRGPRCGGRAGVARGRRRAGRGRPPPGGPRRGPGGRPPQVADVGGQPGADQPRGGAAGGAPGGDPGPDADGPGAGGGARRQGARTRDAAARAAPG